MSPGRSGTDRPCWRVCAEDWLAKSPGKVRGRVGDAWSWPKAGRPWERMWASWSCCVRLTPPCASPNRDGSTWAQISGQISCIPAHRRAIPKVWNEPITITSLKASSIMINQNYFLRPGREMITSLKTLSITIDQNYFLWPGFMN